MSRLEEVHFIASSGLYRTRPFVVTTLLSDNELHILHMHWTIIWTKSENFQHFVLYLLLITLFFSNVQDQ